MNRVLCVGPTPAAQRVMIFREVTLDAVNRATSTLDGIAGKSINVAKVLKALGESPIVTGFIGGDRGAGIQSSLAEQGIANEFIKVVPETRQCTTVIDQLAGTITELVEESAPISRNKYRQLYYVIRRHAAQSHAIVLSGTLTPEAPTDFYQRCVELAIKLKLLSVVDAKGSALLKALKACPSVIKPNRSELEMTVGQKLAGEREVMAAMRKLCKQGAQRVIVTSGKEPTLAFDGNQFWRIRGPKIAALNPIGSGDAFTAGLVWQLLRRSDFGEACRWATAAGAANALTLMAGKVRRKEVQRLAAEVRVEKIG